MRRLSIVTLTLGALLVGACSSERDTTSPRGINPGQSLAVTTASSCSFSTMKSDAKLFFASQQDSVYTYIGNMQQAFNKFGAAGATSLGWSIQKIVAAQRLTSSQGGTSANGASFVLDVFACMDPTLVTAADTEFTNNLSFILSDGIFEVRGDATNALPAWAWHSVGGARVAESPAWGVEPVTSWPSGPYLVFAFPKNVGTPIPSAANIDGTFSGFELGSVPASVPKSGLRVGVCVKSVVNNNTTANRLLHSGAILINSAPTQLCLTKTNTPWPTFIANATTTGLRRWFASLFTTQELYAQTSFDFTGGTPDGWSPFGTGALVGSQIGLAFTTQLVNTFADSTFTVVVQATIPNLDSTKPPVPVPAVDVTLSVAGNNGSIAGAVINGGVNPTVTTGTDGTATFTISVGKAGGYTISATGMFGSVATQSATSNQFQVQNK